MHNKQLKSVANKIKPFVIMVPDYHDLTVLLEQLIEAGFDYMDFEEIGCFGGNYYGLFWHGRKTKAISKLVCEYSHLLDMEFNN